MTYISAELRRQVIERATGCYFEQIRISASGHAVTLVEQFRAAGDCVQYFEPMIQ